MYVAIGCPQCRKTVEKMSVRELLALYRVQLRVARLFDARPRLKCLLEYPLVSVAEGGGDHAPAVVAIVEKWQRSFLGGTHYAKPRSLCAFVSEAWRAGSSADATSAIVLADAAFNAQLALVRIAAADEDASSRPDHSLPAFKPPIRQLENCSVLQPGCLLIDNAAATVRFFPHVSTFDSRSTCSLAMCRSLEGALCSFGTSSATLLPGVRLA